MDGLANHHNGDGLGHRRRRGVGRPRWQLRPIRRVVAQTGRLAGAANGSWSAALRTVSPLNRPIHQPIAGSSCCSVCRAARASQARERPRACRRRPATGPPLRRRHRGRSVPKGDITRQGQHVLSRPALGDLIVERHLRALIPGQLAVRLRRKVSPVGACPLRMACAVGWSVRTWISSRNRCGIPSECLWKNGFGDHDAVALPVLDLGAVRRLGWWVGGHRHPGQSAATLRFLPRRRRRRSRRVQGACGPTSAIVASRRLRPRNALHLSGLCVPAGSLQHHRGVRLLWWAAAPTSQTPVLATRFGRR